MPKIDQQKPPTKQSVNGAVTPIAGSGILSTVVSVSKAVDSRVSLLLYGRNRVGKTTLACQFEKPLLLISLEPTKTGGARSVSNIPGVMWKAIGPKKDKAREVEDARKESRAIDPFCHLQPSERIAMFAHELKNTEHPFRSVAFDGIGSWEKLSLQEIMGTDEPLELLKVGKVSSDDYTLRSERMRDGIRPFLNLPCNVIFLANEKDHSKQDEGGVRLSNLAKQNMPIQEKAFFSADSGPGLARWLQDSCDFVAQMFMDKEVISTQSPGPGGRGTMTIEEETGKFIRRLRMRYHPNYAAGPRTPYVEDEDLPEFVEGKTPKEMYANLYKWMMARGAK